MGYYLRKNFKGWKGPAVVLGQDGQFVLVRHGGAYFRVHPCQLMKVVNDSNDKNESKGGVVSGDDKSMKARVEVSDGDDSEDLGDVDDMTANSTLNTHETKPKRNTFVKYKLGESDWKKAKVLSLQPKQSGKYK